MEHFGKDQFIQMMWEYFCLERVKAKKFLKNAEKGKHEGIQGQWQQESPAKEILEQVKSSADTDSTPEMMRFGYCAMKDGTWEECTRIFKAEVSSTDWKSGSLRIERGVMLKSTDFLRRIIAPVRGQGGVTLSYLFPHCNSLEDYIWWVSTGKKRCSWWCPICGGKYEWRAPNTILVVQLGTNEDDANVIRAHAVPQGLCENLINAFKLLANQQRDVDSPIQSFVTGLPEKLF